MKAIFLTNQDAENYKILTLDLESFELTTLVKEKQLLLESAVLAAGNKLVLCYLNEVKVWYI